MAKTFSKFTSTKGNDNKIIIPAEILDKVEKLPDKQQREYADWEDKLILEYSEKKGFVKIASLLERSESSVNRRYHKLIKRLL